METRAWNSDPQTHVGDARLARNAARTLAGVKGTERSRTPVASKIALAIAAGTTAAVGSPAPHGFSCGRSIRSIATSGTSGNVKIGYVRQSRLVTVERSNCKS